MVVREGFLAEVGSDSVLKSGRVSPIKETWQRTLGREDRGAWRGQKLEQG